MFALVSIDCFQDRIVKQGEEAWVKNQKTTEWFLYKQNNNVKTTFFKKKEIQILNSVLQFQIQNC